MGGGELRCSSGLNYYRSRTLIASFIDVVSTPRLSADQSLIAGLGARQGVTWKRFDSRITSPAPDLFNQVLLINSIKNQRQRSLSLPCLSFVTTMLQC